MTHEPRGRSGRPDGHDGPGLRQALMQAEHARAHLSELYDLAPFAYVTTNSIGVIQDVNGEAARLLRSEAKLLPGRRLHSFVAEKDRRRLTEHLRRCRSSPGPRSAEVHLELRGGQEGGQEGGQDGRRVLTVELRTQAVNPTGRLLATALVDLSDREAAIKENERLMDAGRQAIAANAAKDQFIAMLSHELRTPLTPVLAAVSALRSRGDLPEALRPLHEMIYRNLVTEARLIDDLLDATRIARGKLRLEAEATDVHEAASDVVQTLSSEIQAQQHRVLVALDAEHHHVRGDPMRVRQIFWNLVRNAIKFTPPGGCIELRSWNNRGAGELTRPAVMIEVSDNGRGFAPEMAAKLFSPFEQGSDDVSGGLGLGLAICRGLVDLHGGQLTAASGGTGRGARFVVQLPTVTAAAATLPAVAGALEIADDGRKPRILLVEDHADTSELLLELLGEAGYQARGAASIGSALAVDLAEVDLVVSDLGLPDGTGLDLMRRLAGHPRIKGIALSGYGTEADVKACKEAGFSAHLTKPVDWPRLLEVIGQVAREIPSH